MTWDGPEIICRSPLDALFNQPNQCGCPVCCPKEHHEDDLVGLPNETMGVPLVREDLAKEREDDRGND